MVLKKSNSGLNSGATQRVRSRGKFRQGKDFEPSIKDHYIAVAREGDVNRFGFRPAQEPSDIEERYVAAEKLVMEFLGQDREGLLRQGARVQNIETRGRLGRHMNLSASTLSLEHAEMWNLPERIHEMVKDEEFAVNVSKYVNLNVSEIQKRGSGRGAKFVMKKDWSAYGMAQHVQNRERNGEIDTQKTKKSERDEKVKKSKTTCHPRGIKRPAMWGKETPKKKEKQQEEQTEERPKETLYISLVHPDHLDARDVNLNLMAKRFSFYSYNRSKKASSKLKHTKSMNWRALHHTMKEGSTLQEPDDHFLPSHFCRQHCPQNVPDDCLDQDLPKPQEEFDILDFCVPARGNRKSQVRAKGRTNHTTEDKILLKQTNSHVQYISEEEAFEFLRESTEDTQVSSLSHVAPPETTVFSDDEEDFEVLSDVPDTSSDSSFETLDCKSEEKNAKFLEDVANFNDEFTTVTLNINLEDSLCGNIDSDTHIGGDDCNNNSEIVFGNCVPACFYVRITDEHNEQSCHLIGNHTGENTWLVSLQNKAQEEDKAICMKQLFTEEVDKMKDNMLDIDDLIHFSHLAQRRAQTSQDDVPECKKDSAYSTPNDTQIGFSYEVYGASKTATVCSRREAIALLTDQKSQVAKPNQDRVAKPDHPNNIGECDICLLPFGSPEDPNTSALSLLPCGHVFCRNCWRTHAHSSIKSGKNQIPCMVPECPGVMNEAIVTSLLPYALSCQHREIIRDRSIDLNPSSSWCPSDTCDKVIVLTDDQAGRPVTCSCGHSWCHSCTHAPHWPATCQQARDYHHLQAKTSESERLSFGNVTMQVTLRPCPKCKYPIEKHLGCPAMYCVMCHTSFCWTCMHAFSDHDYSKCKADTSTSTTVLLENKMVLDHPIEYFLENCLKCSNKIGQVARDRVLRYIRNLRYIDENRIRLPVTSTSTNKSKAKSDVIDTILKASCFLHKAFTVLEYNFVMVGFARYAKRKELVKKCERVLFRLEFIVERIEARAFNQSFVQLYRSVPVLHELVDRGEKTITEIDLFVPNLQRVTRGMDSEWLTKVDLRQHYRYK